MTDASAEGAGPDQTPSGDGPEASVPALAQFWRFWSGNHPFEPQPSPALPWYAALWLAALGIGYFAAAIGFSVVTALNGSPPENAVNDFVDTNSVFTVVLLAGLIGPAWEELAFRLPVSGAGWTVALGGSCLIVLSLPALLDVSATWWLSDSAPRWQHQAATLAEITVLGGLLWVVAGVLGRPKNGQSREDDKRPNSRMKWVAAIGLTVMFACAHLTNFGEINALTPILVVPQLLLGSVIMFARVNRSWWLGLGIHSANNLLAISVPLLARLGGGFEVVAPLGFLVVIALGSIGSITALSLNLLQRPRTIAASSG